MASSTFGDFMQPTPVSTSVNEDEPMGSDWEEEKIVDVEEKNDMNAGENLDRNTKLLETHWRGFRSDLKLFNNRGGRICRKCPACSKNVVAVETESLRVGMMGNEMKHGVCFKCNTSIWDDRKNDVIFVHEGINVTNLTPRNHHWFCKKCMLDMFHVCSNDFAKTQNDGVSSGWSKVSQIREVVFKSFISVGERFS